MKRSDLNHLRRLLGWVRCDIGQAPAEVQTTMIGIADKRGNPEISVEARARVVESYRRAEAVPVYVRDAVKALEKTVAAAGRGPGAETARATAEPRTNAGFDPGAATGREATLDDVEVERGLAEIGVHAWGPRAEDWLAGAEYAARCMRGSEASPTAEPPQSLPDAAAKPVAWRDTPAAPPTLRQDEAGGQGAARRPTPTHGVQEVQVEREAAGPAENCRPAITLQVMQEALRLMPSEEARRVARAAEAVSSPVTPEQYVGAGAVAVIAELRAPVADERAAFEADYAKAWNATYGNKTNHTAADVAKLREGDGYVEDMGCLKGRWDRWQARAAQAGADDVRNALEEAAKLCFDPQDAERIRALKQPRTGNEGGHLDAENRPVTRASIGFRGGHLDANTVVLPPLPETIAWATVNTSLAAAVDDLRRAAVLADRQQRADAPTVDQAKINIDVTWRTDDPDLMVALGRQFLAHPQTRPLVGREALVLRCVRAALDAQEGEAC